MIRSSSYVRSTALAGLLSISMLAMAQAHRHVTPKKAQAIEAASNDLKGLVAAQQAALNGGNADAIAEATRPLIASLLRDRAKLYLLAGKPSQAPDLYRRSLALVESSEARLELASALLRSGHAQEAATEAATVARSEPLNLQALRLQASALRAAGDDQAAVTVLSHALDVHPDGNVAYALGSALLAIHQKERADKIFQQIIQASGNAVIWHVAIGDAYREGLYLTDAVEEFKRAVALDPRVGHAEFFLGLTYLQLNQWGPSSQSFEHLRAAVRLAPHEYISNFYLGALESTDGSDLASSNRHLHVAAEADPTSPEVWLYLGLNAVRERDTTAAKLYLRKAVALTGKDEQRNNYQIRRVYAVLGRILIAEGNKAEGDALLASYKRTEQKSLGNSASVISAAAQDESRSALSTLPKPSPSLPETAPADTPDRPEDTGQSINTAAASLHNTPEQMREMAAAERQVSDLLASSFNDLGTAEARQGKYGSALEHFQEAERWGVPSSALLRNLGVAAFRIENFAESARALKLFLEAKEKTARDSAQDDRAHIMLAMSLFSLGRFTDADTAFSVIPAATMQDPRTAYSWAYSLVRSGKQQHANQIADQLTQQPLPSDALSLACHLYMDTENYERSVECYRRAYAADPALKLAHYQAAESLIRLDRPAEAIPELKQELALSPDNPDVQYSLAFALLQTSHKEEAKALLQQITAAHPTHAQAQYQLGKTLLEEGSTTQAVQHLEQAVQNDPGPDYIHYQLQAAYRKAGRVEDAERELKLYREIKARARNTGPPQR